MKWFAGKEVLGVNTLVAEDAGPKYTIVALQSRSSWLCPVCTIDMAFSSTSILTSQRRVCRKWSC